MGAKSEERLQQTMCCTAGDETGNWTGGAEGEVKICTWPVKIYKCPVWLVGSQAMPARARGSDNMMSQGREDRKGRSVGSTREELRGSEQ